MSKTSVIESVPARLAKENLNQLGKANGEKVLVALPNNTTNTRRINMMLKEEKGVLKVSLKSGRLCFEPYVHGGGTVTTQRVSAEEALAILKGEEVLANA